MECAETRIVGTGTLNYTLNWDSLKMEEIKVFNNFLHDLEDLNQMDDFRLQYLEHLSPAPSELTLMKRRRRLNPFTDLSEEEFRLRYRFSTENMRRIIDLVRDDLEDQFESNRSNQVPVEIQIMCAIRLWGLALNEHPELTAMAHNISTKTLAKICRRVSVALASKASRYIRMPATLSEKERVTNDFRSLANMPSVIGALTHFTVRLKRDNTDAKERSLDVQIVADASYKIRDLDCKSRLWVEKQNALEMFSHTRIKERFEQNEFRGRVLLANERLHCCAYLFTPVQCPATNEEQAFNRAHDSTFNSVNNCVQLWKKRFGILNSELFCSSYATSRQTIVALALLHNMAVEWNDPSLDRTTNGLSNHVSHAESTDLNHKNPDFHARLEFIKNYF